MAGRAACKAPDLFGYDLRLYRRSSVGHNRSHGSGRARKRSCVAHGARSTILSKERTA